MKDDLKRIHEVEEVSKSIDEINHELNSSIHDLDKLREINKKAKQKFLLETSSFELGQMARTHSSVSLEQASVDILLDRLPLYKSLYEAKLLELQGNDNK